MIELRAATERGHTRHDWLESWHSFAFADYRDPAHLNWGPLRVLNEDRLAPAAGFPSQGHRDIELITLVFSGVLEHRDTLGNTSLIRAGEVQRISTGQGVVLSESNPSSTEPVHFLQIGIIPDVVGLRPGYAQARFTAQARRNRLCLLVSGDAVEGSLDLCQDLRLYGSVLDEGSELAYHIDPHRLGYLHVAHGQVRVGHRKLAAGDGLRIGEDVRLEIAGGANGGELLLFDLPALHD